AHPGTRRRAAPDGRRPAGGRDTRDVAGRGPLVDGCAPAAALLGGRHRGRAGRGGLPGPRGRGLVPAARL
ncbi:MAG: hypothetical protein AVDCRST_MAG69-2260, partial [uncultured Solirubrobacteraceae bacterium]